MPPDLDRLRTALADRYRIEQEVGSGGMATVYLAEDLKHRRKVAVKVLRPELAAALGPDRFLREIQIAAKLQHPHILMLIDSGEADGFLHYVMPYVEGQSLRDKLAKEGELPITDAVKILRDVADALAHAHAQGVVHRDIKPDNVMISGRHALVTDFGVAKAVTDATGYQKITTAGVALGTPAYMAPEQAVADTHVDHRADIYAFGVLAYELLTGRPPFLGPTAQAVLAAHVADPAEPVTKYRDAVPAALGQLVMRCLEKKAADRWQTAEELLAPLEALTTPSQGITPTETRPVMRAVRRRSWIAAALGVAIVAVVALLVLPSDSGAPVMNPNAFAIAPFDVLGSGSADLARDIAELVHHRLDGAGPLIGVPRAAVEQRWSGPADRAAATQLGERVSAGLVVFGRIAGTSPDSVRITATLLDTERNLPLGDYEATAATDGWYDAANALALWTLQTASRSRRLAAVPLKSIGSVSPAAVKAFLTGDGYYRRSQYDSARPFYEEAITADSTFALAHSRLGMTKWNAGISGWPDDFLRAGRFNHGLAQRESLLIAWDSLFASHTRSFNGDDASWTRYDRLAATGERLVRLYPLDVEAWYVLGEWRYHIGPFVGVTDRQIHEAFVEAARLDAGFAETLVHLTTLTLHLEGADAAIAVLDAAMLPPDGVSEGPEWVALVRTAIDPNRSPSPTERADLTATRSPAALLAAAYVLKQWPDSIETAIHYARAAAAKGIVDVRLGLALAYRGHLAEARTALLARPEWSTWWARLFPVMARLGSLPADSADALFRESFNDWRRWRYHALSWWRMRRDSAALRQVVALTDSEYATLPPIDTGFVGYLRQAARAHLAIVMGDTASALATLANLPTWPSLYTYHEWLLRAQVLAATGRLAEAAALLARPPYPRDWSIMPEHAIAVLERARVHERLGNHQDAIDDYSYVVDVWRNADSVLQVNYVTPARERLARLTAERER